MNACQSITDDLFKPRDRMTGLNNHCAGLHRLVVVQRVIGVACAAGRLRERQKVHGMILPLDAGVSGVFHHTDDLMRSVESRLAGT